MSEIRAMELGDVPRVHQIDASSFSAPWPAEAFSIELVNPKARNFVITENEMIVGFIVYWLILDECHIATIAVEKGHRGKGYAKELLRKALQSSLAEGAAFVYLEVRASNHPAKELYRSFGFEIVGTRKKYYKDNNEDALLLTLEMKK